jgi:ferredoxin
VLAEALTPALGLRTAWTPAGFLALGAPRDLAWLAFRALAEGRAPAAPIPLPERAPFGEARVAVAGCTLCVACTTVCPTGALTANPDRPELRFREEACVQCGLCAATCPEKVINLVPRLDLSPAAAQARVVKEEAPFPCARCGKPFGTASAIARVKAKLSEGGHWMFADPARLAMLELCEDCRVFAATDGGLDPHAGPPRPLVRTAADYGTPDG